MKIITQLIPRFAFLFLLVHSVTAQNIAEPQIINSAPLQISFLVTNGNNTNQYFKTTTDYSVRIRPAGTTGNFTDIYSFQSTTIPKPVNAAFANITRTIEIPFGQVPGSYELQVVSSGPNATSPVSRAFNLFCDYSFPTPPKGYIKSSSPALTFHVLEIENTGNLKDRYTLNVDGYSDAFLEAEIQDVNSNPISETPILSPGQKFTFLLRLDTPNGTPPDQTNFTQISAVSEICQITKQINIETYIYGGNGNGNSNLPDSPDLSITKSVNNASNVRVGDILIYTITINNISPKKATNPTITDLISDKVELLNFYKNSNDARNISFNFDDTTRRLTALYLGDLIQSDPVITISIEVRLKCSAVPEVENVALVSSVSGDVNDLNDQASVTTLVDYDFTNLDEIGTWIGTNSDDWFECFNWADGVIPNQNIDVTIPVSSPSNPVIDSQSPFVPINLTAFANKLTIETGKSLIMRNEARLSISNDFILNGNFNAEGGTVIFNGDLPNYEHRIIKAGPLPEFNNLVLNTGTNAKGLRIDDGRLLSIKNELHLLSGDLRLYGKAQLIQTHSGVNANTYSAGTLSRDQQGTSNKYNFNYWSSPVGINNASNYNLISVILDGTNPLNPQPPQWTPGVNGATTTPITISNRWIYTFENTSPSIANWNYVSNDGSINPGAGFTMKGNGNVGSFQNYTFKGQVFNGDYTIPVAPENLNLVGSPYPSALDAYAFLDDNQSTIDGTLYFWDHFDSNNTHVQHLYEGGYASLTKVGVVAAVSPTGVVGSKFPKRYLPVGQGFMVFGNETGGQIIFKNSQRVFKTEDETDAMNLFRGEDSGISEQTHLKLQLKMKDVNGIVHPILIGFMDDLADDNYNIGYDGKIHKDGLNQLYVEVEQKKLNIIALGSFDEDQLIPLSIETDTAGLHEFELEILENPEINTQASYYLYDKYLDTWLDLSKNNVILNLQKAIYNNRFYLSFTKKTNPFDGESILKEVFYANNLKHLVIRLNHKPQSKISLVIYNIQGQVLQEIELHADDFNNEIEVSAPLKQGVYILNAQTDGHNHRKKFFVK